MALRDVLAELERGRKRPVERKERDERPDQQRAVDEHALADAARSGAAAEVRARAFFDCMALDCGFGGHPFAPPSRPGRWHGRAAHVIFCMNRLTDFSNSGEEDDDDDEIDLRHHRGVADIRAVAVFAEDEARNRVGRPARSARRDIDDDVGELQFEDDAQQNRGHADRQHERKGDLPECLPAVRPRRPWPPP